MSDWPQLIFVITAAIVFAVIALCCIAVFMVFFVACMVEYRRISRKNKLHKARAEINSRSSTLQNKRNKKSTSEDYWNNMLSQIDKEFR